jgi:hypothetical protein
MADDDFDIFAGAGEYEGIDLGDEEDEEDGEVAGKPDNPELEDGEESAPPPRKWFEEDEPDPQPSTSKLPLPTVSDKPPSHPVDEDEEGELEQPTRLVPLASSALPSIKDLLAMDKAANSSEKRRKKKDKKKSGKDDDDEEEAPSKTKMSAEVKAERDYKRFFVFFRVWLFTHSFQGSRVIRTRKLGEVMLMWNESSTISICSQS